MYLFSPKKDFLTAFRIIRSNDMFSPLQCAGEVCVDFGSLPVRRVVRGWSEGLHDGVLLTHERSDKFKEEVLAAKLSPHFSVE